MTQTFIRNNFSSIESFDLRNTSIAIPPVTPEDKAWVKEIKKKLKSEDADFNGVTKEQIRVGNIRRVFWLLHQTKTIKVKHWSDERAEKQQYDVNFLPHVYADYMVKSADFSEPMESKHRTIFEALFQYAKANKKNLHWDSSYTAKHAVEHGRDSLLGLMSKGAGISPGVLVEWVKKEEYDKFSKGISYIDKSKISDSTCKNLACESIEQGFKEGVSEAIKLGGNEVFEKSMPEGRTYYNVTRSVYYHQKSNTEFLEFAIDCGMDTDLLFYYAVSASDFEFAAKLVENYHADPSTYAKRLIEEDIKETSSCKRVEFLKGYAEQVDLTPAIEYAQRGAGDNKVTLRRLREMFGVSAVKPEKLTWEVLSNQSIRKRVEGSDGITHWKFSFEERIAIRSEYEKSGALRNSRCFQFGEIENQNIIHEAAKNLKEQGGDPGVEYSKTAQATAGGVVLTPRKARADGGAP